MLYMEETLGRAKDSKVHCLNQRSCLEEGLHFQTFRTTCIPSLKMQALFSAKQETTSGIYPASGIPYPVLEA